MISLNGHPVQFEQYPNRETIFPVVLRDLDGRVGGMWAPLWDDEEQGFCHRIQWRWEDDAELLRLIVLVGHLSDIGASFVHLEIPYLPYSRMDRAQGGAPCSLRHVAQVLNRLEVDSITVWDPHSDATAECFGTRFHAVFPNVLMIPKVWEALGFSATQDFLIYPDAGAAKRYHQPNKKVAVMKKKRHFATGQIESIEWERKPFAPEGMVERPRALIVDDISSYGGTFVRAAALLREHQFREVHLLITHAEEAILDGDLLTELDSVWCSDSLPTLVPHVEHPKLHVYKESEWRGLTNAEGAS